MGLSGAFIAVTILCCNRHSSVSTLVRNLSESRQHDCFLIIMHLVPKSQTQLSDQTELNWVPNTMPNTQLAKDGWMDVGYLISFIFFFILNVVDLQCCFNFWCTAKWFSHTYIYIYTFFYIYILFHFSTSQNFEYSSLCSTVGTCCLYIYI